MGLEKFVRARKAVKASRAGEWSPAEWTAPKKTVEFVSKSEHDDWDTPTDTKGSPSNKELMAAKDAKTSARNEANNTPMAPVTVEKSSYNDNRMRYLGDD